MKASEMQADAKEAPPLLQSHRTNARTIFRNKYLGNLLLFFMSIVLSLAAAESFLRMFPQLQSPTGEGEYVFCSPAKARHLPHPTFGYIEVPGNSYFERFSPVDPWTYVKINDEGFRDNFDNNGKPVIVLGDSMTRGSLVNENEVYTGLMELWHPDMSFRNYGIGGYGQPNSIRVYEEKGRQLAHRLVILQYSMSTDIDDNAERAALDGDSVKIDVRPIVGTPSDTIKLPVRVHLFFWNHSKIYAWFYNVGIRPFFSNWDARRDMDGALEVTRRLLAKLASEARSNRADLLILILPSWAEMAGRDNGMEPERERAMLRNFVADTAGVFLLDTTPVLATEDPNRTYGVGDKHLTPYGNFLVAQELDRWLVQEWPAGPKGVAPTRSFHENPPVIPDCSRADSYLRQLKSAQSR